MAIKVSMTAAGATITRTHPDNPDKTAATDVWSVSANQLGRHLIGIDDAAHPWCGISAGDLSALLDLAAAAQ